MSSKANYFKLGLFVLAACAIAVVGLLMFGLSALRDDGYLFETYMDESVQGLDVGSPVKMRGVRIGSIEEIAFTRTHYPASIIDNWVGHGSYVLIRFRVNDITGQEKRPTEAVARTLAQQMVGQGLRARLAMQGITGTAYLELDYMDVARARNLEINWEPEVIYIPSAPSVIKVVSDSFDAVFGKLEDIDLQGVANDFEQFLEIVSGELTDAQLGLMTRQARELMQAATNTTHRVNDLIGDPALNTIPSDIAGIAQSGREMMGSLRQDVRLLLNELDLTIAEIRKFSSTMESLASSGKPERILDNMTEFSAKAREAGDELPGVSQRLNQSLAELLDLLTTQRQTVHETLRNMERVSENLVVITDELRHNPGTALFGGPPAPSEVTQ